MLLSRPVDARGALQAVATACYLNRISSPWGRHRRESAAIAGTSASHRFVAQSSNPSPRPITTGALEALKVVKKPAACTSDELHYVPVPGTEWKLALWRYLPAPEAPPRNHPLMLLSGVGTNAIGYDLSPGASFARHMSNQGFDTWIVEVRGSGLSTHGSNSNAIDQSPNELVSSELDSIIKDNSNGVLLVEKQSVAKTDSDSESEVSVIIEKKDELAWDEPELVTKLSDTFLRLAERLSGYMNEAQLKVVSAKFFDRISKLLEDARLSERYNEIRGNISCLLEARETSSIATQIKDLSQRLIRLIEEGQQSVSPQLVDLQERLSSTIEDFQKQLDLIVIYDWDFDNYLEEDIPAAMEYIKLESKPMDGRLLAIGHSMGGILLYALISKCGSKAVKSELAAVVTLASSVDYTSSKSSLKLLLPLADPAQALNVPVVPLGALLAAAYPLASRPPYVLSWLNPQISAPDMMHPELFEKLVLNNFCTIPAKLILQLTTAFREGGLRNRSYTFSYRDHLHKCDAPVLALAGDQDLICPPEAVYETVKLIPEHMITYRVFGKPNGPRYAHYDLVGGRLAVDEVYPCIIEFLSEHDGLCSPEQSDRKNQTSS